jgi:hypothetical protein
VATCAFGDLFDILGYIQQQLVRDNRTTLQLWEANIFMKELDVWLQSLPNELLIPTISGLQRTDPGLLENTIKSASDARKVELVKSISRILD